MMLKKIGIAEIIPQQEISGPKLLHTLKDMEGKLDQYKKNIKAAQKLVPETACQSLIKILENAKD